MKTIRPIYIEKCDICGEEFDKMYMHEIFTGRKKYICNACFALGEKEVESKCRQYISQKTRNEKSTI